jgi:hypothetical protein
VHGLPIAKSKPKRNKVEKLSCFQDWAANTRGNRKRPAQKELAVSFYVLDIVSLKLVSALGLEPRTHALKVRCSTT